MCRARSSWAMSSPKTISMLVTDVPCEIVFGDDIAHVGLDFIGGRDRRPDPWLEAVAEGVEIAVGADAGIAVRQPGAAKTLLGFQDHEARARKLRHQAMGAADAGNAGADDQDIEMLGRLGRGRCRTDSSQDVHDPCPSLIGNAPREAL